MENEESNTQKVPSEEDSFSKKWNFKVPQNQQNNDYWLREFIKVNQCPQRFDLLENQLKDMILIAEKFGLVHAAHFIKNYYQFKCKD
jgi:hypothetical protein